MSRFPRKLTLSRETIRILSAKQLARIHTGGGYIPLAPPPASDGPCQWEDSNICSYTETPECRSQVQTCDTNTPECPNNGTI